MRSVLRRNDGAVVLISLLALGIALFDLKSDRQAAYSQERRISPEQVRVLEAVEGAFTAIADTVEPAVVQIKTEAARPRPRLRDEGDGNRDEPGDPFDDMLRRFPFEGPIPPIPRGGGTGSGVISRITGRDVFILTNKHVVDGADKITVIFHDSTEVSGKDAVVVRGTDELNDLAVIKVTTAKPLDPNRFQARLGDSDKLRVGQWAVAIGSPFGLASTFTVGVISALNRSQQVERTAYTNFIQTDAAINPGNSGGALVNVRGEVIGINTAIATGGLRANAGIGFAIPINKAKRIMEQLIAHGKVTHGYIGVLTGDLDAAMRKRTGAKEGALVQDVNPGTPASKADIRPEDVIVEFNGKPVRTKDELIELATATPPGTKVRLKLIRRGQVVETTLTLGERPSEGVAAAPGQREGGSERAAQLGIRVGDITPEMAESLRLPSGLKGVVVLNVMPGSPAADKGIQRGDVITRLNDQPVTSLDSFQRALEGVKEKEVVYLRISRANPDGTRSGLTIGIDPAAD